jgi:hypothetical protein
MAEHISFILLAEPMFVLVCLASLPGTPRRALDAAGLVWVFCNGNGNAVANRQGLTTAIAKGTCGMTMQCGGVMWRCNYLCRDSELTDDSLKDRGKMLTSLHPPQARRDHGRNTDDSLKTEERYILQYEVRIEY